MTTKMTAINYFIDGVGGVRRPVVSGCVTTRFRLLAA